MTFFSAICRYSGCSPLLLKQLALIAAPVRIHPQITILLSLQGLWAFFKNILDGTKEYNTETLLPWIGCFIPLVKFRFLSLLFQNEVEKAKTCKNLLQTSLVQTDSMSLFFFFVFKEEGFKLPTPPDGHHAEHLFWLECAHARLSQFGAISEPNCRSDAVAV